LLSTVAFFSWACAAAPAPSDLPVPATPPGWTSLGSVQADASDGMTVGRYTFSGLGAAVHGSCRGDGTLFVIVGWSDVTSTSGPARFESAAFPCLGPTETPDPSRIELTAVRTGEADVGAFVLEGRSAIGHPTYAVSIEERDP
jgi:hypothetical protein